MFKVKHRSTEQVCEFATKESLAGFLDGIADKGEDVNAWELVEDAPGTHVELTGKPVPEAAGSAAKLTEDVLERASAQIEKGEYSLAYAASGISAHYGADRQDVYTRLTALVAPLLNVEPTQVDAELLRRAEERVRDAEAKRQLSQE